MPNIELHALAASQESQNPAVQKGIVEIYQLAGVGLVLRETASIGQSDTDVVHLIDQSILETETGDGAPIPLEMIRRHCFANQALFKTSTGGVRNLHYGQCAIRGGGAIPVDNLTRQRRPAVKVAAAARTQVRARTWRNSILRTSSAAPFGNPPTGCAQLLCRAISDVERLEKRPAPNIIMAAISCRPMKAPNV